MAYLILAFVCTSLLSSVVCRSEVSIKRSLSNDGFHRDLVSNIELYSTGESYPCSLLLVEYLPNSVYVDTDQLSRLSRQGKLEANTNGSINIEAAAGSEKATPFKTYIFLPEQPTPKYTHTVVLPVHLRYQSPVDGGGYTNIAIGQPSLFSRCAQDSDPSGSKFDMPCAYHTKSLCKWTKLQAAVSSPTLQVSVPVGDASLSLYVSVATYVLLYSATFLIARAIYYKRGY